ncbi:AI-2E family transporter [Roseomonas sp. SSH11]|uniref:AI-2E family transporter n=1 Tax=Pararoseomonas baculiformis TaxID=2820812 RepID=A0ABS4AAK0_9PROT|nr:AI-2E family transporter [Pararoseomonas baculiformis]MBP0443319.1 AI-2E family transporter [Pararoseomonas baculiformis]
MREAGGSEDAAGGWRAEVAFLRRVLIVVAVLCLVLVLWWVREALLIAFAGVVVAVLLLALAKPLEARLGLSRTWSLLAVGLALGALIGLAGFLVGDQVQGQIAGLGEQLPRAVSVLEERFGIDIPPLEGMIQGGGQDGERGPGGMNASLIGTIAGHVAAAGRLVVSALSALVLVVVGGFFLAADPALYRRGAVKLVPESQQARVEDALLASGEAIRLWLGAQLVSMVIVGLLTGIGSWLVGLPSPLALGLFAGLVGVVPLVGAVVGAVPALILAAATGGSTLLWTAILFIGIQQVESNMIMPLVERRMVSLPPALILFAVVAVGLLFGVPGILLAAPMTVVAFVLVKKLYVRETLGQRTEVPGEDP